MENTKDHFVGPYSSMDELTQAYEEGMVEAKLRSGVGPYGSKLMADQGTDRPFEYAFSVLELSSGERSIIGMLDRNDFYKSWLKSS